MKRRYLYGIPCACAILCYLNGLTGQLVYDDIPAIQKNKDLRPDRSIYNVLYDDYWGKPIYDAKSHKSYRPITVLTFRFNYNLHGLDPLGFHVINIILHAIVTELLVHMCATVVFTKDNQAFITGLLFAIHPIHTEAVTSIVGRADVLCAVFFILTVLSYHKSVSNRNLVSVVYLAATCVLAGFATLSKEQGITSLVLCVLLPETYVNGNMRQQQKAKFHSKKGICDAVVILWAFMILMLRISVMRDFPVFLREDNPVSFERNLFVRMMTQSYVYSLNVFLMLYPMHLCHDWSYGTIPMIREITDPKNVSSLVFLVLLAILLWKVLFIQNKEEKRVLTYGLLFGIFPFTPASNIFCKVGFVIAERILYIPSIGYCILFTFCLTKLYSVCGRKSSAFVAIMFLSFAAKTVIRNQDWTDRERLARSGIVTFPHNAKLQYNFANVLREKGLIKESIYHYQEAIRLWPEYASAHNNLATVLMFTNISGSLEHLNLAIYYNPAHSNSYFNLAAHSWLQKNYTKSIFYIQKAIDLDPSCDKCQSLLHHSYKKIHDLTNGTVTGQAKDPGYHQNPDTILNIAAYSASTGIYDKAITLLDSNKDNIKESDTKAKFYFMLGECYKDTGELSRAIQSFTVTVELMPEHPRAHHNLAVAYHIMKNLTEASYHYRRALELDPSNPLLLENYHKFKELEGTHSKLPFSAS